MKNQHNNKISLPASLKRHLKWKDVKGTLVHMDKTNMVPVITMTNVSRLTTLQDLFAKESPKSGLSWEGRFSIQDKHGNRKKMGLETSRAFSKLVENGPKSDKVRSFLNRRLTKDKSNVLGSAKGGIQQSFVST